MVWTKSDGWRPMSICELNFVNFVPTDGATISICELNFFMGLFKALILIFLLDSRFVVFQI